MQPGHRTFGPGLSNLIKTCPGFGVENPNSFPRVSPIPATVREALQEQVPEESGINRAVMTEKETWRALNTNSPLHLKIKTGNY